MNEFGHSSSNSSKKVRCKSHSIFGNLGFRRLSTKNDTKMAATTPSESEDCPPPPPTMQRNRSVSFAVSSADESCSKSVTLPKFAHYSASPSASLRSTNSCHHHGSVLSLVMRQKNGTMANSGGSKERGMMISRPSTPSFVRALISPRKSKGTLSSFSLDECEAHFDSECSSSKRNSSSASSSTAQHDSLPPSPWKSDDSEEYKDEFEKLEGCETSIGHLFANNARIMFREERRQQAMEEDKVLCAEGNTQYYLLSMVAPPGKKVVNIGRSIGNVPRHPRNDFLRQYNPNNLNPVDP